MSCRKAFKAITLWETVLWKGTQSLKRESIEQEIRPISRPTSFLEEMDVTFLAKHFISLETKKPYTCIHVWLTTIRTFMIPIKSKIPTSNSTPPPISHQIWSIYRFFWKPSTVFLDVAIGLILSVFSFLHFKAVKRA